MLQPGPVFEFFVMNATNAESTPQLNLFQIEVTWPKISTLESIEIATCADRKDLPCALQIALPDTGHHKHGDGEGGLLLGMSGNSGSAPPAWHEVWTAPGWVIYPELTMTSVETANPGYGLHGPQTSADGKWY